MSLLLPRLPGPACETLVRSFLEIGSGRWLGFEPTNLPTSVRFAATGGTPVGAVRLRETRVEILELARTHGFDKTSDRNSLAAFDAEAAAWLAQADLFSTGEALRDDVWSFMSAVLAPDIVCWRFGSSMERYTGGIRNTFQRLWMRGRALDRGAGHPERWRLLKELTEDALVQITERPSIGGDPVLSLAVAEAWVRASSFHGRARMEEIMRRAILAVRIRNEIRSLSDLPADRLAGTLDEMFGISVRVESHQEHRSSGIGDQVAPAGDQKVSGLVLAPEKDMEVAAPTATLAEACESVLSAANRRGLLSPKSKAALIYLRSGRVGIRQSERNALDYLLTRLSGAGLSNEDLDLVRSAASNASQSKS